MREQPAVRLTLNSVEDALGQGIVCHGVKVAGKTNTGTLAAASSGHAIFIPVVVCDREGDAYRVMKVALTAKQRGRADPRRDPDEGRKQA